MASAGGLAEHTKGEPMGDRQRLTPNGVGAGRNTRGRVCFPKEIVYGNKRAR